MFELIQPTLKDVLRYAQDGKLQLPDFQRGWAGRKMPLPASSRRLLRNFDSCFIFWPI